MTEAKILTLHDLEGQRLFAAIVVLIGLIATVYGLANLLKTTETAMSQAKELSERVAHLSRPAVASTSEPVKT